MVNCKRCEYMDADNGNCTAVGGFCTAVPAAHCLLLTKYLDARLRPGEVHSLWGEWNAMMSVLNSIGSYDRLRELAEADKEGRVVVLPCKQGTVVYVKSHGKFVEKHVGRFTVYSDTQERILVDLDRNLETTQRLRWDLNFGKTIFLSREEAERALEVNNG